MCSLCFMEQKPDSAFMKGVTLVALFHAIGHSLTNVSFASVAVSFTHTIKSKSLREDANAVRCPTYRCIQYNSI